MKKILALLVAGGFFLYFGLQSYATSSGRALAGAGAAALTSAFVAFVVLAVPYCLTYYAYRRSHN